MRLPAGIRYEAADLIARRLGLRFPEDRKADLERGLLEALRPSQRSPEASLAWLAGLPDGSPEWGRLASRLTVGETCFFRDRAAFEALEGQVLPSLIASRRGEGNPRLRLWSAGCATGEEPYSLAILLDRLLPDRSDWALTILATDIDREALESAERGLYREWAFRETPSWIRDRYFHRRGETFELNTGIRRMATFAPLNLAGDGYPSLVTNTGAMDLILCRNVLMYFAPEAQRESVTRLQRALVTGGWLVMSPAEASADLLRPLIAVNFPDAIFYRKERTFDVPFPRLAWRAETVSPGALEPQAAFEMRQVEMPQEPARPVETAVEEPSEAPRLERARGLADQGRLEDARRLCEDALAWDLLDPEGHFLLAAICQELGDIAAALEGLRRTIYLAPESAPAHFLLGTLLLREGARARGRRCLETAIRLLAGHPSDEALAGGGGLTAGRLKETARAYLAEG